MNRMITFLKEVRTELNKVSWPTRNQLINYTGVVLGLCLFMAIYLGALDSGFSWLIGRLIGR